MWMMMMTGTCDLGSVRGAAAAACSIRRSLDSELDCNTCSHNVWHFTHTSLQSYSSNALQTQSMQCYCHTLHYIKPNSVVHHDMNLSTTCSLEFDFSNKHQATKTDLLSKSSTVDFWDNTGRFAESSVQGRIVTRRGTKHARTSRACWWWTESHWWRLTDRRRQLSTPNTIAATWRLRTFRW